MAREFAPVGRRLDELAREAVDAAYRVHSHLGPGLLEHVYEVCLQHELKKKGLRVEAQLPMPVVYDDVKLECGYRIDLLMEKQLVLELKSVDALAPIHTAQTLTYLKLSKRRLALLINFNVPLIKNGIRRLVN